MFTAPAAYDNVSSHFRQTQPWTCPRRSVVDAGSIDFAARAILLHLIVAGRIQQPPSAFFYRRRWVDSVNVFLCRVALGFHHLALTRA